MLKFKIYLVYTYIHCIFVLYKKQIEIMKTNFFTIVLILISINVFGQEKQRVFAPSFNQEYANLVVEHNGKTDTLKVIEETMMDGFIKMSGKQYNRFYDAKIDNGTYRMKKVFKLRPVDLSRFFNESYIAEYFYNENGKHIIILQKVNNSVTLK